MLNYRRSIEFDKYFKFLVAYWDQGIGYYGYNATDQCNDRQRYTVAHGNKPTNKLISPNSVEHSTNKT